MPEDVGYAKLSPLEARLVEAMEAFDIIDSHEHLTPEKVRVETEVDVFTLFSHYTRHDLFVAGMREQDYQLLYNRDIPIERRWAMFEPYWQRIRHGSYARAALIAAKKFYGADDINRDTYQDISARMREFNTSGIYERVLGDACNIRMALAQCGRTDLGSPLLTPVMPLLFKIEDWQALNRAYGADAHIRALDDLLDAMKRYILSVKAQGAVGLKMHSNPYQPPDRSAAVSSFEALRDGKETRLPTHNPLRDYVVDSAIDFATREDLVIAVHTGYWRDFRELDPLHMIPLLERHPRTRFDIYHLGYPWVRPALMLGKGFPNVWLNLCWTHIISQRFAQDGIDEALDLVPVNKILAFGGDYATPVEKVYGHLIMAREDFARVFARRIEAGLITEEEAIEVLKLWFWDNPKELYRLDV